MSGKVINEKEFGILKKLINSGVSQKEFTEATGRKHATYSRVKHCETWEEYQDYIVKSSGWNKEKKDYKKNIAPKETPKPLKHDEIMKHYKEIVRHLITLGNLLEEE